MSTTKEAWVIVGVLDSGGTGISGIYIHPQAFTDPQKAEREKKKLQKKVGERSTLRYSLNAVEVV